VPTLVKKIKEVVKTLLDDASKWYELQENGGDLCEQVSEVNKQN